MIQAYNTAFFYNQFKGLKGSDIVNVPDDVVHKIELLNPDALRFPGGTLANSYDCTKKGYGTPSENPPLAYPLIPKPETPTPSINYIDRHIDLISRLSGTSTIYVANVYQALLKPENTAYWVQNTLLAIKKIRPSWVELGNELNIDGVWLRLPDKPGFYFDGFIPKYISEVEYIKRVAQKANDYLAIADKFATAIRAYDPNIKIAIPMGNPFTVRNKEWNRVLRTWGKNDNEVFHIYLTTKSFDDTKSEIMKCLLGSQKPVLITEWSWSHGNQADKNLSDVGKEYYNFFFKDFVEVCKADKRVEMICRHMLAGSNVYCIIKI